MNGLPKGTMMSLSTTKTPGVRRRTIGALLTAGLIAGAVGSLPTVAHAVEPVGTATLTEIDLPGTRVQGAAPIDLAAAGYTETEYYATGTANRYTGLPTSLTAAAVLDSGNPYTTRVVVRTPTAEK